MTESTEFLFHLPNNLEILDVSNNSLKNLPNNFPDRLDYLDVSNNKLKNLPNNWPNNWPNSLRFLDVTNNKLTSLPNNLPDRLEIKKRGNPLKELTQRITENTGRYIPPYLVDIMAEYL